ncbi:hypothetical protein [Paraliobacillus sp. X-1268]|uniref:hypothetical protein n=1 Tax=Paraliobacillus sp. X-1268 TaxID=2213193 RepID=UPI0018E52D41|nr:hypothetical protein [Paraliobacillus sp. X-1268]
MVVGMREDAIQDCLKEIKIRLACGETMRESFKNPIYQEDLTKQEKKIVKDYFK